MLVNVTSLSSPLFDTTLRLSNWIRIAPPSVRLRPPLWSLGDDRRPGDVESLVWPSPRATPAGATLRVEREAKEKVRRLCRVAGPAGRKVWVSSLARHGTGKSHVLLTGPLTGHPLKVLWLISGVNVID